uniref:SFRICE_029032 n=1 Tax=Spodoptera frugiperda TaxID=7108 RepID=A0A2H1VTZ9_SPOFR
MEFGDVVKNYREFQLREPPIQQLLRMLRGGAKHMSSGIVHVMCVFYVAPLLHEHLIASGRAVLHAAC